MGDDCVDESAPACVDAGEERESGVDAEAPSETVSPSETGRVVVSSLGAG